MEAPLDNSPLDKPADVFDRDAEWADLTDFARSPLPGLRVGARLSRAQDVVDCVAVSATVRRDSRPGCIFIHRPRRRELTILPLTAVVR
jgi:hypothetical protein